MSLRDYEDNVWVRGGAALGLAVLGGVLFGVVEGIQDNLDLFDRKISWHSEIARQFKDVDPMMAAEHLAEKQHYVTARDNLFGAGSVVATAGFASLAGAIYLAFTAKRN